MVHTQTQPQGNHQVLVDEALVGFQLLGSYKTGRQIGLILMDLGSTVFMSVATKVW